MQEKIEFNIHIDPSQQGTYFTVPFSIPPDIEAIKLTYRYPRRLWLEERLKKGVFYGTPEKNIVDLGLISPKGVQVGASGSDKLEIQVSETNATPGYTPCPIVEGEWRIIVGAYKIVAEGVDVSYEIKLVHKSVRLLKGDLHVHSVGSDGVHTLEELAFKAKANGLDFLTITDHNQMIAQEALPRIPGVTIIPGVEWTHYQGHANFLGISRPYDEPFFTNTTEEAISRFTSTKSRGALITVNHPFEGNSSFKFDLKSIPFDCLEVWNGPMRKSNLRAVGLWQQLLMSGMRIPISGGSDYHRDTPFIFLGGPTMCVYAMSAGVSDILAALRQGHGFLTFAPNGPVIEMNAGDSIMGDLVDWNLVKELHIHIDGLLSGDTVKMVTGEGTEPLFTATSDGSLEICYAMDAAGFARVEVLRAFLPGLPMLPALISNPIYFMD